MHPVLDVFRNGAAVGRYGLMTLLLIVAAGLPMPSHAQAPGYVSVVFAKAGLVVGAGGGRGALAELANFARAMFNKRLRGASDAR